MSCFFHLKTLISLSEEWEEPSELFNIFSFIGIVMDPTKLNDQKLQEFLQRWPELSLATDQDNDEILSLTREVSMESGANKICFDDAPNFLTYPMSLGSDCLYFIWRNPSHDNKKGELVGTATIIFKDKIFDGAKSVLRIYLVLGFQPGCPENYVLAGGAFIETY